MTDNLGMAPCDHESKLSLALCKPEIRKKAVVGDYVIGNFSKTLRLGNRAWWLGRVSEVPTLREFYTEYGHRPDAIYRVEADGELIHKGGNFHNYGNDKDNQQRKDKGGEFVLVFDWYAKFSVNDAPLMPEEFCHPSVGQKSLLLTDDTIAFLGNMIKQRAGVSACNVTGEVRKDTGATSEAIAPCAGMPTCHGSDDDDDDTPTPSGDNLDDDDDDDTRSVETEPDHPSKTRDAARGKRALDDAIDEDIAEVERDPPVTVDGIKCIYSWNGERAKYVYEVHNAHTREYFEPEDWDGITGADEMKKVARSKALEMAKGKEGEFESIMVKCFAGDRGGRGVVPDVPSLTGKSQAPALEPVSGGTSGTALPYVSVDAKCVGYSVANLLHDTDAVAALTASQWPDYADVTTRTLRDPARECHIGTLISQLKGWRAKGTSGTKGFYDKKNKDSNLFGLLDWFLQDDAPEGMCIAMLRDDTRAADHCVGIDTKRRLILDPSRTHALPLKRSSFDLCVADGHTCVGVAAARKLYVG